MASSTLSRAIGFMRENLIGIRRFSERDDVYYDERRIIGLHDETWWSRFTQPRLHAWSPDVRPLRLVEQVPGKTDRTPKALACYGLLLRQWMKAHNRQVRETGQRTRIFVCPLPIKSPWLNPIELKCVHGKRRVTEPDRTLSALEVEQCVCAALDCSTEAHLSVSENAS